MWGMTLAALMVIGIVAALWHSHIRARELALAQAQDLCQRRRVQLLDNSVVLDRLRPGRNTDGQLCWVRRYSFEYSAEGASRAWGVIELHGRTVTRAALFESEGLTLEAEAEETTPPGNSDNVVSITSARKRR